MNVEVVQHVGVELKMGLALEHDVILIHLRIHRVNLPLAKGVIQRVVDGRGRDAESRGRDPIDDQRYCESSGLLVGGNVLQFRQLLQTGDEAVGPVVQFIRVGVFERVLVLGAADAIVDSNVLHRLHE